MGYAVVELGRFVVGLTLIAGLYMLVRAARAREGLAATPQALLEGRLHYGVVGILGGSSFFAPLQDLFAESTRFVLVFFAGWFGLVAGCGFDLRLLRRNSPVPLLLEAIQAGFVACLILLAWKLLQAGKPAVDTSSLMVICGICVLGGASLIRQGIVGKSPLRKGSWQLPLATYLGILLAGLGNSQLHEVTFQIDHSFAATGRGIMVEGLVDKLFWSLVLGAVIGLAGDFLTRDVESGQLFFLFAGTLLLGSGMAASLGLEPMWVGLVAGIWLMNATLRRLDVLEVIKRGHGCIKKGLLFIAGWLLGNGLIQGEVDMGIFFGVLLLLLIARPVARMGSLYVIRHFLGNNALKSANVKMGYLMDLDELALVIPAVLLEVLPAPVGLALLGAVMMGQLILRLIRGIEYALVRYSGITGQNESLFAEHRKGKRS